MKKAAVFILTCAACMFLFWYAGVDFSERGFFQAWLLGWSLALSGLVASLTDNGVI
jgi:hypothetical protein